MSVKRNMSFNSISQFYVIGLGIIVMPQYLKYMGQEAYGLVGLFIVMQAWFAILDMGLTPTIGRETARWHGGATTALKFLRLFRVLHLIFFTIAVPATFLIIFFSDYIAEHWLSFKELELKEVTFSVQIMVASVSLRWMGTLYRGVVTGSENFIWLSSFNSIVATFRFVGVYGAMYVYGFSPTVFFIYQIFVAAFEFCGLKWKCDKILPKKESLSEKLGWSLSPIKDVMKFSLTIAFTASVWILVTQTDKLIVSGLIPLEEYGYFTLAIVVSNGIMALSAPLNRVVQPRLTRLMAEGKRDDYISLYISSAKVVSIVALFSAFTISLFAYDVLHAWTGDVDSANQTRAILQIYVLGSGMMALASFPSMLQNALGNLYYHLVGNLVILVILLPLSIALSIEYGAVGAAWAWLAASFFYLVFWTNYTHKKLIPGYAVQWFLYGVLKPVLIFLFLLFIFGFWVFEFLGENRVESFLHVFLSYCFSISIFFVLEYRRFFIGLLKG